jgi:hypothetical protein
MFRFKATCKRVVAFSAVMLLLLSSFVLWEALRSDRKFPMIHPAEDRDAVPVADAKELLQEFAADSVGALKKYRGRIWLRGTVTEISGPSVTLEGPPGVLCVYVSVNDQMLMRIRTSMGKQIMIEGNLHKRGGNLTLFRPWKLGE